MNKSYTGYWYGDQWTYLRDAYGKMTKDEQIIFQLNSQIPLIGEVEFAYISGTKIKLAYQVMLFHALNEALRNNPEKYREIFDKKHLIVDFKKMREQANKKPERASYFQ